MLRWSIRILLVLVVVAIAAYFLRFRFHHDSVTVSPRQAAERQRVVKDIKRGPGKLLEKADALRGEAVNSDHEISAEEREDLEDLLEESQ